MTSKNVTSRTILWIADGKQGRIQDLRNGGGGSISAVKRRRDQKLAAEGGELNWTLNVKINRYIIKKT